MRYVTRGEPPPSLSGDECPAEAELIAAREHYADENAGTYEFAVYKNDDVVEALRRLFHGKCAYCESSYAATQPVDIEHYRPKGRIDGEAGHRGYWWLAMQWSNLLPSCIDCNRRRRQNEIKDDMTDEEIERAFFERGEELLGKADRFPIRSNLRAMNENDDLNQEDPLIIDPTRTDPDQHIGWDLQSAMVVAVPVTDADNNPSPYAKASIRILGLNRAGLAVERRAQLLRDLMVKAELLKENIITSEDPDLPERARARLLAATRKMAEDLKSFAEERREYTAMVNAFIKQLERELNRSIEG